MGNTKFIRILIILICLLIAMFSYASDLISGTVDELAEKLATFTIEIKQYESMHPDGIPTVFEANRSLKMKDFQDLTQYYVNLTSLKFAMQAVYILQDKKENADEVIRAYREVFGIAQKIGNECKEVGSVFEDACMALHRMPAKISARMAIEAAHFCAKVGRLNDAKEIYREVIVNYTGLIYKPYVKQAEFGLEDLKELEQQRRKKTSKGK